MIIGLGVFLNVLQVITALVLVAIVMSQSSKQEGIGAAITGRPASTFRGKPGKEEMLQKATMYAAIVFFIVSAIVGYLPQR